MSAPWTCPTTSRRPCTSGWHGWGGLLRGEPVTEGDRDRLETIRRARTVVQRIQNEALAAARAEVLAARREPGVDPEAADRVLHRLDPRTVLLD
jgi:CPA1 family monovalent cation:H+ antiporter